MGQNHWRTVNRLIATWLDDSTYQTGASFVLDNYEDLGNMDPAVLLQRIETRLVTADQLEYKRIRFQLAKQTLRNSIEILEEVDDLLLVSTYK